MDPTSATTTSNATAQGGSPGVGPPAAKTGAGQFWAAFILALIADAVLQPVVSNSWSALPGTLLINFVAVRTFVAYHPVHGPVVIYFGLNLLAATLFWRRGWPKVAAGVLAGTVVALLVDVVLLVWIISTMRFY